MGTEEYRERLQMYQELIPEVTPYIKSQAYRKVTKLPVSYVGLDDLIGIGYIEAWVAVLRWNGDAPLIAWTKRVIWTRMNLTFGHLYRKKRTARVMLDGQETTSPPLSLEDIGYEPAVNSDPVGILIAEEVYSNVRERLLDQGKRVAAGVLRLLVYPDGELLKLCQRDAIRKNRHRIRLANYSIAERLGVSTPRVANAKVLVRRMFKELWN